MHRLSDLDELLAIIHAMTGEWLSAEQARKFAASAEDREELLAHGILDLKWLETHPAAARYFDELTNAGRLPYELPAGLDGPKATPLAIGLSREDSAALLKQFAENATDANPLSTLREMASKQRLA